MRHGLPVLGVSALILLAGLAAPAFAKPKARKLDASAQLNGSAVAQAAPVEPEPPPLAAAAEDGEAPPSAAAPSPAAAVPSDAEPPAPPPADAAGAEQLGSLQTELSALMDELVQARTRAALIGKTLFKTQVRVHVQNLAGDDAILAKIVLKLDGAPIFRGDAAAIRGDEERQVFEGFLAPGPHVFTAEVEQNSRDDSAYGYNLRETYKFQAIRDKRNELRLVLRDYSDVASEFPDDQEGEYDVRTQLRVETKELNEE